MAAFENIVFVEGDCLDQAKLPPEELLAECDSVIHMVGAITDDFNYKKVIQAFGNTSNVGDCVKETLRDPSRLFDP